MNGPVVVEALVDRDDYPVLAALAEARGFDTIGAWLGSLTRRLTSVGMPHDAELEILHRAGATDPELAAALHMELGTVRVHRRRLRLPANPVYPRKAPTP